MEKDKELIDKTLEGDLSSFDELMKLYQQDVFISVNRMINNVTISLDICQNIFIKVFRKLDTFRYKSSFKTWLIHIAMNETFTWIRKNRKRYNQISINDANAVAVKDMQANPEELLDKKENVEKLGLAMMKLNPQYRKTVFLRYYEEKTLQEIAALMSCSVGVVKNRLFRSLRQLRSIMNDFEMRTS